MARSRLSILNAVKEPKVNELSWEIKSDSCFEIIHEATKLKRSICFCQIR